MLISGLLLILNTLNVVLHTTGTYALLSLYNDSKDRPQRLLLINHSFCDSIRHCLDIVLITVELISLGPDHVVSYVVFYVKTVIVTGVCVVYYLAMVYITLNKLSKIILTSSYDHYWKEQRAKKLVLLTWAFGLLVCAVCAFVTLFSSYDIDVIFHSYIFPVSDFVFIAVAVTTLTVIIHSYNKRKRKYLYQKYRNRRRSSSIKGTIKRSSYARRRSQASELGNNFFVPAGLILIFLVLIVIPDVTYYLVRVVKERKSYILLPIILILHAIASQIDACVYLFFLPDVRRLLTKKLIRVPCDNFLCLYTAEDRSSFRV